MKFSIYKEDILKCRICEKTFLDQKSFLSHLRSDKTTQIKYFEEYFPKKDLLTGATVNYKNNFEKYFFSLSFDNRENLIHYARNTSAETRDLMFYESLKLRKKGYKITKALPQVNLRGGLFLSLTAMDFLNSPTWSRNQFPKFCADLSLKQVFDYNNLLNKKVGEKEIWVDTREQLPVLEGKVSKLSIGDYSLSPQESSGVFVERKSFQDAMLTFGKGFDRFCREIERAKTIGAYLVVVIEENLDFCYAYKPSKFGHKGYHGGTMLFSQINRLFQNYDNIQFLFTNSREESARLIPIILSQPKHLIESTDLQYLYDFKKL